MKTLKINYRTLVLLAVVFFGFVACDGEQEFEEIVKTVEDSVATEYNLAAFCEETFTPSVDSLNGQTFVRVDYRDDNGEIHVVKHEFTDSEVRFTFLTYTDCQNFEVTDSWNMQYMIDSDSNLFVSYDNGESFTPYGQITCMNRSGFKLVGAGDDEHYYNANDMEKAGVYVCEITE